MRTHIPYYFKDPLSSGEFWAHKVQLIIICIPPADTTRDNLNSSWWQIREGIIIFYGLGLCRILTSQSLMSLIGN